MRILTLLSFLFIINYVNIYSQNIIARPDSFCIMSNETIVGNVKANDTPPNNPFFVFFMNGPNNPPNPCFELNSQTGVITLNSDLAEECCGDHRLKYAYESPQGQMIMAFVDITIKCPKPNCSLIDLAEEDRGSAGGNPSTGKKIFYACEDSPITYFVEHIPGYTYTWSNSAGAPITTGANPAEIFITWPNPGSYTITLVTNTGTGTTTQMFCVEVLAAPVASFTTAMNCVCLNSPISFTNTSTGASSYYWDFGDGNNSTMPNPTHTYNTPGTYTVTLYAYNQNYDPMGNPLCCCTDSTQMVITVDEKPGPNIYWISTLCEGDSSKYWTDASGCNFTWAISGNGTITSGQGTDTICVVWGAGPFGQITLTLSNCSPAIWCEKPVTVQVPIISTVEFIDGDIQVCAGSKEIYSLPKWAGTIYDWTITGGMIVSGDSSHQVVIMWGNGPTGTIHVDYWNPFLQCLPGHDEEDCKGVADLNVNIRPEYNLLTHPTIVCLGDNTTFSTDTPAPPLGFTFVITPPSGPNVTLINNQTISYTWTQTGVYSLCLFPNDATLFCNDTICTSISVIDIDPIDSITGEKLICPNETYIYTAHSNESNVKYNWTVTGGTIVPIIGMGNPVMITWNNTGPYSISVTQEMLNNPFCESLPIVCPVTKKQVNGPLTLTTSPTCINSQSSYSIGPVQQAGATFNWSISLPTSGSIIAGQGSPNITVQWNNTPGNVTLNCWVKICNDSLLLSQMLLLKTPIPANITQIGMLCPGVNVQLNAGVGPYTSANWTPAAVGTTITVSSPGLYVVTTTDMMGCKSTDSYNLNSLPGPLASITTAGPTTICTTAVGTTVVLQALTNPNYQYQWYDQFNNPIFGQTNSTFTYTSTGVIGIFSFKVKITDMMTGCMSFSNWITIIQSACGGGPGGNPCIPLTHTVTLVLTPNTPVCEKITFNYNFTGASITPLSWSFGDPFGTVNMPGPVNAMFTYSQAGTYPVCLTYEVPAQGGGVCTLQQCGVVDIPIVADFYSQLTQNCREIKFINTTSTQLGVVVTNYNWNYGDGNFFNTNNINVMPTHTYATSGSYLVTLTATTTTGCIAIDTMTVNVLGPVPASYTVSTDTVCVGDPVAFTFTGNPADVLTYLYNFGDLSNNGGPNPSHSYANQGLYVTSLTITDVYNCTNTTTQNIFVHPALNLDTITYFPDLTVCFGDTVVLTAPGLPSFTFNWSGGQTTQSISVSTTGWHHVTVTDNNGCMDVTDSVEVVILPPPIANISGPQVVCDSGCVTLNATLGFNYSYQWFDVNGDTIPFATNSSLMVCLSPSTPSLMDSVYVIVTDTTYGCSDTSTYWVLSLEMSPSVIINTIGTLCEGSPNLLTAVATPAANIIYTWSNGDIGPSIIVYQAGTYTVFATDTLTGCSDNATVIINPLPDLCAVPSGCYEICEGKLLCGPLGLASYQWNFNGVPIPGETNPCVTVSQTGSYSLTATNNFGCSATSDTLILVVIPCCEADDTEVIATPISISGQECCYSLSYANSKDSIMSIVINTANANIQAVVGSLPAPFQVSGFTANTITITHSTPNTPLPVDTLPIFIKVCANSITSSPALILIDWNWPGYDALCQDSVWFECHTSDTCVYVKNDTVLCRTDGSYLYIVEVCNGANNTWPITFLDIVELAPPGIIVTPGTYNTNIPPGTCQTFTFILSGSNLANQNFCYNLLAHEDNPLDDPNARCCSLDTAHCVFLPGCGPCDSVYVEHITPSEDDSCCYTLTLNNYHDANTYFGIGICALTPTTTLSLNNPGITWSTDDLQPTSFILGHIAGTIPLGSFTLPEFCVSSSSFSFNDIEVKWLGYGIDDYITLCSDTIEVYCPNDCGYWEEVSAECDPATGGYVFGLIFHNTSPFTIYSASLNFTDPALPANNTIVTFPGGVAQYGIYGPIFINVNGTGLKDGDTLCIVTTLHNSEGENPTSCCQFKSIIILPDCDTAPPCECDKEFEALVDVGINIMISGLTVTFTPPPGLTDCDKVIWDLFYNQTSVVTYGNTPFIHTFPQKGVYEICVTIIRTTPSGEECKIKFIETVKVKPAFLFKLHPNPARDMIQIVLETDDNVNYTQNIELFNTNGQKVMSKVMESKGGGTITLPISELIPGLYNVRITSEDLEVTYKRFIKTE